MAELISRKIGNLMAFCTGIRERKNGRELYERYIADIQAVTPTDLFVVMTQQLILGASVEEILGDVDKLINVFHEPLSAYVWKRPEQDTFLDVLMQENAGLIAKLEAFKSVIKQQNFEQTRAEIKTRVSELQTYHSHMLKLENILFPYLEKVEDRYEGLKILWALHDVARKQMKETYSILEKSFLSAREMNVALGQLYFLLYGLVEKQELILFPAASEVLSEMDFKDMQALSFEFGFAFINPPKKSESENKLMNQHFSSNDFTSVTGSLSMAQIEAILNTVPIDMTLIDENDKVKYFSNAKKRIFPRSPAIIGRDVRNCHPPKSVHIVERILDAFKRGEKDSAKFWIRMNDLFVVIEYFALRDENGAYMGTLEVSQEVSDIRTLRGERRLLDWDK